MRCGSWGTTIKAQWTAMLLSADMTKYLFCLMNLIDVDM
jgi:hypothetical protein